MEKRNDQGYKKADLGLANLRCQQCGHQALINQYHCFDMGLNPQWKEVLMKGEFFHWECPECGAKMELSYPCRYFDPEQRLSIALVPGLDVGGGQETKDRIASMNERLQDLGTPGFLHRAAGTFFAVQELVRLREEGLDDRIVQLLKPLIIGALQSEGLQVWNGFFVEVEDPESPEAQLRINAGKAQPPQGVIYISLEQNQNSIGQERIYWYDIHLTDRQILRRGINETAYHICRNMLLAGGTGDGESGETAAETAWDDGQFHLYDLNWAIDIHNQRNHR